MSLKSTKIGSKIIKICEAKGWNVRADRAFIDGKQERGIRGIRLIA